MFAHPGRLSAARSARLAHVEAQGFSAVSEGVSVMGGRADGNCHAREHGGSAAVALLALSLPSSFADTVLPRLRQR